MFIFLSFQKIYLKVKILRATKITYSYFNNLNLLTSIFQNICYNYPINLKFFKENLNQKVDN